MEVSKKNLTSFLYLIFIFIFFLFILNITISDVRANQAHNITGIKFTGEYPDKREDNSGAFRTHCLESHISLHDPLIFFGNPNMSHLHVFFGNPRTNAFSSSETLLKTQTTTCDGINENKSAYWVPALFDSYGQRISYIDPLFYYKTGYHVPAETIIPPPSDLKIIAGNALSNTFQDIRMAKFRCASWKSSRIWFDQGDPLDHVNYIPNCPLDDLLEIRIVFPQCWNGDTPYDQDFRSHMAYPIEATPPNSGTGRCPKTHPHAIPEISFNFAIYVTSETGPSANWRFSSDQLDIDKGGSSIHADWINGWEPNTMKKIVENCLNRALDCDVGLLGDGTRLLPVRLE